MGMSASQARFLCLTARKNNVEFEGQQINQQRTTLSNESASYYSALCDMAVPVPPSIDDYTRVTYSFDDGAMTNTVTSLLYSATDNTYHINYIQNWQDDYSIVPSSSALVMRDDNNNYSVAGTYLRKLGTAEYTEPTQGTPVESITVGGINYPVHRDDGGPYYETSGLSTYELANMQWYSMDSNGNVTAAYIKGDDGKFYNINDINQTSPINNFNENDYNIFTENEAHDIIPVAKDANGNYVKLDNNGNPIPAGKTYIEDETQIITTYFGGSAGTPEDAYLKSLSDNDREQVLELEKYYLALLHEQGLTGDFYVRYVKNSTTGKYDPVFYESKELENTPYNDRNLASVPCYGIGSTSKTKEILNQTCDVEQDASGRYVSITVKNGDSEKKYQLTAQTITDEDAYNNAMNDYYYKQHEYDHKIQEINSKLEILQQQDKQLELKLKQLDTEENAISTELDAVKKVVSKNIDSSFKTFNA